MITHCKYMLYFSYIVAVCVGILRKPTIMALFWMIVALFERHAPNITALANLLKTTSWCSKSVKTEK